MPTEKIIDLQERMSDHMDAILRCFKAGATITVVVRNPQKREPTFKQGETLPVSGQPK